MLKIEVEAGRISRGQPPKNCADEDIDRKLSSRAEEAGSATPQEDEAASGGLVVALPIETGMLLAIVLSFVYSLYVVARPYYCG